MNTLHGNARFYGNTVMHAAFVVGVFGWGLGYYGPPVFLHEVVARTAWPLTIVSSALTFHFISGAVVVIAVPRLHRKWGVPFVTSAAALILGAGILGWAFATKFWHLYVAAFLTGSSWVALGAAGINAMITPWFSRDRPRALTSAYNGASIGGLVFTPLWGILSQWFGFQKASVLLSLLLAITIPVISAKILTQTLESKNQNMDGNSTEDITVNHTKNDRHLCSAALFKNRAFITLAIAMALGLFAQIGLIAHLYSLIITSLGEPAAGWVVGIAVGMGMLGRAAASRALNSGINRRLVLACSYFLQSLGTLLIMISLGHSTWAMVLGTLVFGLGIGNSSSLPPLIVQTDFAKGDAPHVIALCISFAQATYAFAPTVFSFILQKQQATGFLSSTGSYFISIVLIQMMAAWCIYCGITPQMNPRQQRH